MPKVVGSYGPHLHLGVSAKSGAFPAIDLIVVLESIAKWRAECDWGKWKKIGISNFTGTKASAALKILSGNPSSVDKDGTVRDPNFSVGHLLANLDW